MEKHRKIRRERTKLWEDLTNEPQQETFLDDHSDSDESELEDCSSINAPPSPNSKTLFNICKRRINWIQIFSGLNSEDFINGLPLPNIVKEQLKN